MAAILAFPQFIPHYEHLDALEPALYLPKGSFVRRRKFTRQLCSARISHYHRLGVATVSSMVHKIDQLNDDALREVVDLVEEQRSKELRLEGEAP
jgi:hypothetical protein